LFLEKTAIGRENGTVPLGRIMRQTIGSIAAIALLLAANSALADVFILSAGGRLEGELLNPDEKPRKTYQVELAEGSRITLDAAQVEKVQSVKPDEQEYEKVRRQYADTVEGQWALAKWCLQKKLLPQRDAALQRVVELDPNHAEARHALGYSLVGNEWTNREDIMRSRGMVLYKGSWRTQQEVDLIENKQKQEVAEKEWYQSVDRWRGWLNGNRSEQGKEKLLNIKDPMAASALIYALKKEESPAIRSILIEALANLDTPDAVNALAVRALDDSVEEVRLTCLDYLQKKPHPQAVAYFVSMLKSKDNSVVNRAGMALGRMKDLSTVGPLIDALVTTHKFKIQNDPGRTAASFGTGGGSSGGGFSFGGSPTKIISQQITNENVRDALVRLTGKDFGFDKQAWKYWAASQKKPEAPFDARRDKS
jgi:hypothetical protein